MADKQGRKWQITINNPQDKGLDHDTIKLALDDLRSLDYYCVADENWLGDANAAYSFIHRL